MKKFVGFFPLLLAAALYGSFGLGIRLLDKQLGVYQQVFFRYVLATIFSILFLLSGKKLVSNLKNLGKISQKLNLILYIITVTLSVVFYNIAILKIKIAVTTFGLYGGTIIFSLIFSVIFFREKINFIKIASLLFVLVGLGFFINPASWRGINLGFLAALASGLFNAAGHAFRKDLVAKVDKLILVFLASLGGIFISGAMAASSRETLFFFSNLNLQSWIVGIIFGFILVAVNYLLLAGFQNFDLSLGSIVLSSELIFALLFGLLFLGEKPDLMEIIGGLFIGAAIILPNLEFRKVSGMEDNHINIKT